MGNSRDVVAVVAAVIVSARMRTILNPRSRYPRTLLDKSNKLLMHTHTHTHTYTTITTTIIFLSSMSSLFTFHLILPLSFSPHIHRKTNTAGTAAVLVYALA